MQGETWGFGMARSHAIGAAQRGLRELCAIVSEATGAQFVPHHAATYADLASDVRAGKIGLAWMPPIPSIALEDEGVAAPIAIPSRQEGTTYHAALITRRAAGKTIADLRGKRVAWVDRGSAAGYLVPRMHVASLGFDVATFFASEAFALSHLGVVDAVVNGTADVGATFCSLDQRTRRITTAGWTTADGATLRPVEVLATIGPIPNDAIVAAARMPASVRTGLARWLHAPDARSRELLVELFHVRAFKVTTSGHFDPLRHMLRAARARGFEA
jgi:ABC-type phosphate/phosphonate transport system substrate-binding protein